MNAERRIYKLAKQTGLTTAEVVRRTRELGGTASRENDLTSVDIAERIFAEVASRIATERERAIQASKIEHEAEPLETNSPLPSKRPKRPKPAPRAAKWETIGHVAPTMHFLTAEEVKGLHYILVEDAAKSRDPIDPPGVKSADLLESALHRATTSLAGSSKYPSIPMAAAAYLHSLILNHPFHNGNKRTALVATLVFLDKNNVVLEAEEDLLFEFLLRVASHGLNAESTGMDVADAEVMEIARWISRHSRGISRADRPIKFKDLQYILGQYGCTFDRPKRGNRINVYRNGKAFQMYYERDGWEVSRNTLHELRKELCLTEKDGIDSEIFYSAGNEVSGFIQKYRKTLDRLAKV